MTSCSKKPPTPQSPALASDGVPNDVSDEFLSDDTLEGFLSEDGVTLDGADDGFPSDEGNDTDLSADTDDQVYFIVLYNERWGMIMIPMEWIIRLE